MSPSRFRTIALVAWMFQGLIVISGAAVRLTEAGLGCEDWPTCNNDQVLPEWELHGWIEFGNRLISLVVVVSAIAAVVAAKRRLPFRQDLLNLAWALVAGTVLQVVLGGMTVLLDLHPIMVSVHFLVSIGLLFAGQKLWFRSGPVGPRPILGRQTRFLGRAQLGLASVAVLLGTVVTGSGPNSGDTRADRLDFGLRSATRIHSLAVWLLAAAALGLAWHLSLRNRELATSDRNGFAACRWLIVGIVAQGAVGYIQFALGVPPGLVEVHVAGSVIVWSLSVLVFLRLFDAPTDGEAGDAGSDAATREPTHTGLELHQ